jgi:CHASE3 domain sensor protein
MSELEEVLTELLQTANDDPDRKEGLSKCMGQTIQLKVTDGEDLVIVADQGKLYRRARSTNRPPRSSGKSRTSSTSSTRSWTRWGP